MKCLTNWTQEHRSEIFGHLTSLREGMETLDVGSMRHDLAEMKHSMIRIQAMGDQMSLMLASTISDLEHANTKSK
jgi:hypothetical protein